MMSSSSASSITAIIQSHEEQATQNLSEALGPKGNYQRVVKRLRYRQKHHWQEHHH
jgi:hypothetical protein